MYSNRSGHMITMATMPLYGKTLLNHLLQNQSTDGSETLYVALNTCTIKIVQIMALD